MRQTIFTLLLVGLLGVGFASSAWAGEWYLNPEDPTYWWFVDGDPRYEVLVPADLDFYVNMNGAIIALSISCCATTGLTCLSARRPAPTCKRFGSL